jgi:single-strand DNA-binding protein
MKYIKEKRMASVNKVILIGSLGRDAETRVAGSSDVTGFSLATENGYKGKDGNWVNSTDWHNIILWSATDYQKKALVKGAKVYVEGRISYREYEKDGNKKKITEIIAEKVKPLDKQEKGSNYQSSQSSDNSPNDDSPF